MELILTLIVLIIVWCIAFMVGNKQGVNRIVNQIKKDGGYYDMEYTSSVYPILDPTSSLNEVPKELLMGGDIDRTLYIAGVKEATPAKITEWENERRVKVETKTELSMDSLLSKLNKTDLQIKAGIIENTDKTGADIKIQVKEIDDEISFRIETARKVIEENTTEIVEDKKIEPCIGHELESQKEIEKSDIDFMHKWIQEKSGKKPVSQKRKPKTTKEWEDEFDLGGHE